MNLLVARRRSLPRRHARSVLGAPARGLHQAGRRGAGREGRRRPKRDLGHVLLKLEELQDEQIRTSARTREARNHHQRRRAPRGARAAAGPEAAGPHPRRLPRCGMVGEETNKLVGYLAAVSRHLEAPLAVMVQSSSAAGKSSLMDAVLAFVPEEERIQYSAMTGQSLYLHGRDGSETQGAGHRRRRRRSARCLRAEAAAERRRAVDRIDRQGPGHREAGHASVPRRRPGDDLPHHHRHRPRRRAAEPLPGADA